MTGPRAHPDTLLGQLQRGRGAGYLGALERPGEAVELILECVRDDPRWDAQIEDRDYYGDLLVRFGADLTPLAEHLRAADNPADDGRPTWLAVDVLERASRRGSTQAAEILADYVTWGANWEHSLWALAGADPARLVPLLPAFEPRLREALEQDASVWLDYDREPLLTARERPGAVRQLWLRDRATSCRLPPPPDYAAMSLPELLAAPQHPRLYRPALRAKVTPADLRLLLSSLEPTRREPTTSALVAIASLALREAFEPVREFTELPLRQKGSVSLWCGRALAACDPVAARRLALAWLHDPDRRRRVLAHRLLELTAILDDVPLLETQILRGLDEDDMYVVGPAINALERLPAGRLPILELAYESVTCALTRHHALRAILTTDPGWFAERFAFESLHEPYQHHLAIPVADRRDPRAAARLAEIAADPLADEADRTAATARLEPVGEPAGD